MGCCGDSVWGVFEKKENRFSPLRYHISIKTTELKKGKFSRKTFHYTAC